MHLEEVPATVVAGHAIYRKDRIGRAGYINGQAGRIHCEVICDDANLARLVGRASGDVPLAANGRADAIFGEIYYHLPAGTQVFSAAPPPWSAHPPAHPPPAPTVVHRTAAALVVGIRWAQDAHVTTYQLGGQTVGTVLREADAEYVLYKSATDLHTECSSAAYEMLRFGRTIGTDALAPANTPHWRQLCYPGGQGWVNLAPAAIQKFSDADFPRWKAWSLVDDSADQDSRMNAATIRRLLDTDGDGVLTPDEVRTGLAAAAVRVVLEKAICKMPTEWASATFDARWAWLKTSTPENPTPLNDDDYARLRAHVDKLSFWAQANLGIDTSHWHFHPKQFVKQFRQCAWYNDAEIARCLPRRSLGGNLSWAVALQRATTHGRALNTLFHKYLGPSRVRHAHALAQIYIETGLLLLTVEGGTGHGKNYGPFFGRGYMQLTWAANYASYGSFRNLPEQGHQPHYADNRITAASVHMWSDGAPTQRWAPRYDPAIVGTDMQHGAESAGQYWISKSFRGQKNINRACDIGLNGTTVAFISWLVNGGGNGHTNRQQFAAYLKNILLDGELLTGTANVAHPSLTPAGAPALCAHFPPVTTPFNLQVSVTYDRQIP
jgi:predicted chitinase